MYKNNSRSGSKIKGCSPLQLCCNLTGMKPANGYYSYTNRWCPCSKTGIFIKFFEKFQLSDNFSAFAD